MSKRQLDTAFHPELIDESVFLASGVVVLGQVRIRAHASIWFNAVVRGDTEEVEIGEESNIQDACVLHADPGFPCRLGARVTVGHAAVVHGAIVEDDVMIGMRAVVLNGARIGSESIIGAGSVVTEGTEIPPRSMVLGVPGKVVRQVSDDQAAWIRLAAQHYVDAARQYSQTDRE